MTFEPHKGLDFILNRWITDEVDDASNCARTGHFEPIGGVTDDDAQGAVNAGPIDSLLPGFYSDLVPPKIPTERFGEAALNLGALLDQKPLAAASASPRSGCTPARRPRTSRS